MKRLIYNFVQKNLPTRLNINSLMKYNASVNNHSKILASKFIKNEIKIRLAHRVVELDTLPFGLNDMPSIKKVTDLYINSFKLLHDIKEIHTIEESNELVNLLCDIKKQHTYVAMDISVAIRNLIETNKRKEYNFDLDSFLDKFYRSRTGIRILISHYLSMYNKERSIINKFCNPYDIINDAKEEAIFICSMTHINNIPPIHIHGVNDFTFSYIPSHLFYITLEILKNSLYSTINFHKIDNDKPINVYLSKGKDDLIIKISDFGGGFPLEDLKKIYSYGYSSNTNIPSLDDRNVLSGFGHGVPLSRLYCRYFGGELSILPFEGVGTDVFIYINRLGNTDETIL